MIITTSHLQCRNYKLLLCHTSIYTLLQYYCNMAQVTRRKVALNTTVSPRIGKQIDALAETGEFSSQSDIVSVALTEFFVREERRGHEKRMALLYSVLIEHGEGRKLLDETPRTDKEKVEAYTRAGIAHVEAG